MWLSTEHAASLLYFRYPLDIMMKWFVKSNGRVKLRLTLTIGSHDTHWHVLLFQALLDDDAHCSLLLYASTKEFPENIIPNQNNDLTDEDVMYSLIPWELEKLEVEWSDDDDDNGQNKLVYTHSSNEWFPKLFFLVLVTLWQNI